MAKEMWAFALTLVTYALACDVACLRTCAGDCAAACSCYDRSACLSLCQTHLISTSCAALCSPQLAAVDKRLLPKPPSVSNTSPFSSAPTFSEDFELTKTERCKATCQTFCEFHEKPGLCPGMCELLFCFQSMETYTTPGTVEKPQGNGVQTAVLLGLLGGAVACIVCMAGRARNDRKKSE